MSSAILYVAIVAIWACVLIPRWLRRDSSVPAASDVADWVAEPVPEPEPEPAPVAAPATADAGAARRRREGAGRERRAVPQEGHEAPADPGQRRVQSARRRLLLMLVGLSVASGVLAGTKMAAWWVVVPPSVMLLGYLLLLREAAKADAERRATASHGEARAARGPVRRSAAPSVAVPSVAVPSVAVPSVAVPSVAVPSVAVPSVAVPSVAEAQVITIPTAPEPAQEEIYDQYADAKLRAVGD